MVHQLDNCLDDASLSCISVEISSVHLILSILVLILSREKMMPICLSNCKQKTAVCIMNMNIFVACTIRNILCYYRSTPHMRLKQNALVRNLHFTELYFMFLYKGQQWLLLGLFLKSWEEWYCNKLYIFYTISQKCFTSHF